MSEYFTPKDIIPDLRRIKLTLEYDGSGLHGWQSQKSPEVPTVQGELEKAFEALTQTLPEDIAAAGRTDKGVHATAMVCHIDTFQQLDRGKIKTGMNRHLPNSIAVVGAEEADQYFHARYTCKERRYEYCILNRYARSPLWQGRAALVRQPLDVSAMVKAAKILEGEHDFSAFRSSECQGKTPITNLKELSVKQEEEFIILTVRGVTFLHNMVRILAGTLVEVGLGKINPDDIENILTGKDRSKAGKTMPAHGLYFTKAVY